jgi:hypothetical protein
MQALESTQAQVNKEFLGELKQVYLMIDKTSALLWSHRNQSEVIMNGRSKTTRSNVKEDQREEEQRWEKETDAQFGYGEITKGAFMNLLTVMQRSSEVLFPTEELRRELPFPLEEYNLTHESTFLDIGSGFGKPVFHASLQTYCKSTGIEIVQARVLFTEDIKWEIIEGANKKQAKKDKRLANATPVRQSSE